MPAAKDSVLNVPLEYPCVHCGQPKIPTTICHNGLSCPLLIPIHHYSDELALPFHCRSRFRRFFGQDHLERPLGETSTFGLVKPRSLAVYNRLFSRAGIVDSGREALLSYFSASYDMF